MTSAVSNCARFAAMPLSNGGTPVSQWLPRPQMPELNLVDCPGLVVVAAHPYGETLGVGGLAATLAERGIQVDVVSVSDGGAACRDLSAFDRISLEGRRRNELNAAARLLGVRQPIHLGFPDGRAGERADALIELLTMILLDRPGMWCAAPWRGDGTADHETVGACAHTAAGRAGNPVLEYPVWMWHWARPGDPDVPWNRAHSVPVTRSALGRKHHAVNCFRSQLDPPAPGAEPALPAFVVRRLLAVGEVVFR
ncbi:PIG-L deacetylase family protein [Mycobacterium sp. ACS4331]|uniref:PIG-L deacetylase family protein n=1 Tax=Mycobacterium sp. ACS4331 TaxID=1834121 RepID=UPI000801ABBA|nr:PIG-L deacetylase family protein [Mycobacterium sp. ACS4331]OBF28634.1 hypothetical protein A5727_24680 [Mycobacterium sp. ACS4331]